MPRYIRLNSLKQTYAEDWRIARGWKAIFLWIPKLFGRRLNLVPPIPLSYPFQDIAVAPEEVPRDAVERLLAPLQEAARLGFDPPLYQVLRSVADESVTSSANCRHSNGEILGRIMHTRVRTFHPEVHRISLALISRLQDGRLLTTSDQPPGFNSMPNVVSQRKVGAPLEALLAMHQKKLAELARESPPEVMRDDAAMAAFCDRFEREAMEHNLRRGLYEEVPAEDIEKLTAQEGAKPPVLGTESIDAAVLAEIEKLRNKRGNWRTALVVGLLSLIAFLALGRTRWDWQYAIILTAVVLLHELGHYIAMRLFHYQDLRMFFIPLFGAAVTGRHFNVKGWQQAVVSLAGPVPGILLGLLLAVVTLISPQPLVEKIAFVALLLNGINLLPFLPLDGGWVLHATLFSRHFLLEAAFTVLAVAALISASMFGLGKFWMYLGLFMLLGLSASYRLARAAARLRKQGVTGVSPDNQTVPAETAIAILQVLKQERQGPRLAKQLASETLSVFQKLNATPPGVLGTILLLVVYLGAGLASLVGTGTLIAARAGLFSDRGAIHVLEPEGKLDPKAMRWAGATNEADIDWLAPTVIATFSNEDSAAAAFDAARPQLESKGRVLLIGQSVLISGSNVLATWTEQLKARGAKVLGEKPASNWTATLRLSCLAPDAQIAESVAGELEAYFEVPWNRTWPPWTRLERLEADRRAAVGRLQYTRVQLSGIEKKAEQDPEYQRLSRSMRLALARRKREEVQSITAQLSVLEKEIHDRELDRLKASPDPQLDQEVIKLFGPYLLAVNTDAGDALLEPLMQSAAWHSGVLPLENFLPANAEAWRAASTGLLQRRKLQLDFLLLEFYRTDTGLPALIEYLDQRGFRDFRYEFDGADFSNDDPKNDSDK